MIRYNAESLTLLIRDNGRGFDPDRSQKGFGLIGMRQRADHLSATLQITSQPSQGTTVYLSLPVGIKHYRRRDITSAI
jgi:signal transduction histidine kinase